ncbi:MAG: hypothetical protein GC164_11315 [Phycisphaera sp.]|nr:hypothetical protein [Phycisphaera sp.]
MTKPLIGITVDNRDNSALSGTYECAIAYPRAVAEAGGVAVLLPHSTDRVVDYVDRLDGFILTGGVDPRMEVFDKITHAQARPMDATRQTFELALLDALCDRHPGKPALGVCLGMQLMALHAGGDLDQFMPQSMGNDAAAVHQGNRQHTVTFTAPLHNHNQLKAEGWPSLGFSAQITSSHRQCVSHAGSMRVCATAPDGVIEAIGDPSRDFYVGVQWHPERGGDGPLSLGLIRRFVQAAAGRV